MIDSVRPSCKYKMYYRIRRHPKVSSINKTHRNIILDRKYIYQDFKTPSPEVPRIPWNYLCFDVAEKIILENSL